MASVVPQAVSRNRVHVLGLFEGQNALAAAALAAVSSTEGTIREFNELAGRFPVEFDDGADGMFEMMELVAIGDD